MKKIRTPLLIFAICIVICACLAIALAFFASDSQKKIKYAPEDGYAFQQLYENEDLGDYDLVEVGIGSLDYLDTTLVYADTDVQDVDRSALEQGIINASFLSGPGGTVPHFVGFAQIDHIDEPQGSITVSGYGPTIEKALEAKQLTLETGKGYLSRGEALLSDVSEGDLVAVEFMLPQDSDPYFGFIWATDDQKNIRLIDHPETYTKTPSSSALPNNDISINAEKIYSLDEAHSISVGYITNVDPSLFEEGVLDSLALEVPQQIILYSYATVDSVSDKTATFSRFGSNFREIIGADSLELLINSSDEHLFNGEATLPQIAEGNTVVLSVVLGFDSSDVSTGYVWLVDEQGAVIPQ